MTNTTTEFQTRQDTWTYEAIAPAPGQSAAWRLFRPMGGTSTMTATVTRSSICGEYEARFRVTGPTGADQRYAQAEASRCYAQALDTIADLVAHAEIDADETAGLELERVVREAKNLRRYASVTTTDEIVCGYFGMEFMEAVHA